MSKRHPKAPWCRYADDGLVHCKTELEAEQILAQLTERFKACKLELHPTKTKIVYCKDGSRKEDYPQTQFDFLGYTFRRRVVENKKRNSLFVSFTPVVSRDAQKSMRAETRRRSIRNRTELELRGSCPVLREAGGMAYAAILTIYLPLCLPIVALRCSISRLSFN